jgi:hypothetical protein
LAHIAVAVSSAVVVLVSLARLVVRHREPGSDAWHTVMATGMVAMAWPAADPLPGWGWAACFGAGIVWAAAVLVRIGPVHAAATDLTAWRATAAGAAHQLAGGAAMLLMLALGHGGASPPAATAGGTAGGTAGSVDHGAGHPGGAAPVGEVSAVAAVAGVGFLVVAAVGLARLTRSGAGHPAGLLRSSTVATARSAVMAAGMGVMLLTTH